MNQQEFRELALSLPETIEAPHFERTAFKVQGKRIFATMPKGGNDVNIKLSPEEQKAFCALQPECIESVPNKWGAQGWTTFYLDGLERGTLFEALQTAYRDTLK